LNDTEQGAENMGQVLETQIRAGKSDRPIKTQALHHASKEDVFQGSHLTSSKSHCLPYLPVESILTIRIRQME
jgi:hypothetical protein